MFLVNCLVMQVISLTEELLSTAKKSELTGLATSIDADASPDHHQVNETSSFKRVISSYFFIIDCLVLVKCVQI